MMSLKSLHKFVSPVLHGSGIYYRLWRRRAHRRSFTAVLAYHRVVAGKDLRAGAFSIERGISADVFEAQLRFMLRYFAPVRASRVLEPAPSPLCFAVTLDDGYEDNFRVAAPILNRLGVPATFYVVSEFVGSDRLFWWEQLAHVIRETRLPRLDVRAVSPVLVDEGGVAPSLSLQNHAQREHAYERLSAAIRGGRHEAVSLHLQRLSDALEVRAREEGREYGLMSWHQLKGLAAQGHDIGGHTATHPNVVGLDRDTLRHELVSSVRAIEEHTEVPVQTFAYPYGHFDRVHNVAGDILAETGCRTAFVGTKGVVEPGSNAFELPRTCLNRRYPFACAYNIQDTLNQAV